ncbi:MAG: DUF721 domain-containing protein [Candidatus Magasanikbacteria bacterium]
MSSFTPLGDTLHEKMDTNRPMKRQLEASHVVEVAQEVFTEFFGSDLSKEAKPLFVKNRTLTVSCGSSTVAQEIRTNQLQIVQKINDKLGKNEVDRIRYLA